MPGVLENGEVTLFFRLLDSLNESLKTLATKYELLTREMERQDRLSSAIDASATKIIPLLVDISKGIEEMRHLAPELKIERTNQINILQTLLGNCKDLDGTMAKMIEEVRINKEITITTKKGIEHIDSQIDGYAGHISSIRTKMDEISKIPEEVSKIPAKIEALRKEIEPSQKFIEILRKPLSIVLIIYAFVTTVIAVSATVKWASDKVEHFRQPDTPTNQKTNSLAQPSSHNATSPSSGTP